MTALASPDYQIARDRIKGNPVIVKMAAGVATVPLANLAHQDGTLQVHVTRQPRLRPGRVAERGQPVLPAVSGGRAEAPRADRQGSAHRAHSDPRYGRVRHDRPQRQPGNCGDVARIIERMRAGESPRAIARETGALQ